MKVEVSHFVYCVTTALLGFYVTSKALGYADKRKRREKVKRKRDAAASYKKELEKSLLIDGVLLSAERRQIVELPVKDLLQKLQEGSLSCVDVVKAYQAKALEVTKELNCVTEFIKEAQEWAQKLDKSSTKGPLHGLPVSIKDNIAVAGYDDTTGVSIRIDLPAKADAPVISALKDLGAVPFCLTNIPQTMLSFGCSNPIWGLTKNPRNKDRTPGGSSGGEGCLIAAGGSPLGIGNDVGGSARVPAAFCGIPSLKPTTRRVGFKGSAISTTTPPIGIEAVSGFLARDVDTVILISKLFFDQCHLYQYDPELMPIPWNEQVFSTSRKLRIGYYDDDGFVPVTPGMRRAVQVARESLQKQGHQLIPFNPHKVPEAINTYMRVLRADQDKYLREALAGEDIDPVIISLFKGIHTSSLMKQIIAAMMSRTAPRAVPFIGPTISDVRYSHQLWAEIQKKSAHRVEFLVKWREAELDLCIAPSFACPAPLSKDMDQLTCAGSYTMLYNLLDFPAGIVPVTEETEEDQNRLKNYNDPDLACQLIKQTTQGAVGMPLAVQVIGLPCQEEMVLLGMKTLNAVL